MLEDAAARSLFDHARRDLRARFDASVGLVRTEVRPDLHTPRDSLWHALGLLYEGDAATAEGIIAVVLAMQERRQDDPHYGNFRWWHEDRVVIDLNAVEFMLEGLTHILLRFGDRLSEDTKRAAFETMRLGFGEIDRLDVHWTYTNIYLLDVHNSILGGGITGEPAVVERGARRLREWADRTRADGVPNEFNSATYSAVQINALAAVAQFAADASVRDLAREMEQFLWRDVAAHFHPRTRQLAGPHSRAYRRDVVGAPDFLKVLLYRVLGDHSLLDETPYYYGSGREGDTLVALTEYHCPPDAIETMRTEATRELRQTAPRETALVTYMTPEFALGTMSRPYGVGATPEPWPAHNACILYYAKPEPPGYGLLYTRYLVNDRRVGGATYESSGESVDLWEEGAFRAAQSGPHAIVAYGLLSRGQKPVHSLRLDVRLLGPGPKTEILAGGRRFDGERTEAQAGEPIVIADGDVYIGIIPLEPTRLGHEPPVAVWREGQETVVSVFNYRGPAKQFWEYRTLSGPFFNGNVRNGIALHVAARSAHVDIDAFAQALRAIPLADDQRGSARSLRFGAATLDYDLRDL
ncbi:MAG TPA: hypothetical protein VFY79_09655 [Dehalococcoidia bacterium]|nr:hypothetical protein [Dehalococcoidia bacterium]